MELRSQWQSLRCQASACLGPSEGKEQRQQSGQGGAMLLRIDFLDRQALHLCFGLDASVQGRQGLES